MKPDSIPIDHVLNVAQLLSAVGPGLGFSTHQLIQQLSECDDLGEPFFLRHGEENYMVSSADLKAFFAENPKPKRSMSKDEENKLLKSQLKQMEDELLKLKGQTIKPVTKAIEAPREPEEEGALDSEPLPTDSPKMSEDEVRLELANDLRGKDADIQSKRGRPKKIL